MKKLVALASVLVLGASLGVAALLASSAPSAPSFARARSYATGLDPQSVAIGDLNGDGKPDLATANSLADSVSVLLNRRDGTVEPRHDYGTDGDPEAVAIGDLNGDGRPDVVTANFNDTVSVLLNRGDGTLQARVEYGTGSYPHAVAIGDLNGDGEPDLATANRFADTVSVLLNRGDGSFQAKVDYRSGNHYSVAIGDLNGDGKLDLVTSGPAVSVLLNRGDGSFRPSRAYRTGGVAYSVAIGDLNGDRKPDLATANGGTVNDEGDATVSVLLNRGDGSFGAKHDYRADYPQSIAIGDLNGDAKPDLVTTNNEGLATGEQDTGNTVSVLVNRGEGSFRSGIDFRTGRGPRSVGIDDLNADGKLDLATANLGTSTVSVLINTPGLCTVQDVRGTTVQTAKRTIARVNCRVGKIRHAYSKEIKRGRVISQKPKPGTVLPGGGKVNLVVSRGRKR